MEESVGKDELERGRARRRERGAIYREVLELHKVKMCIISHLIEYSDVCNKHIPSPTHNPNPQQTNKQTIITTLTKMPKQMELVSAI